MEVFQTEEEGGWVDVPEYGWKVDGFYVVVTLGLIREVILTQPDIPSKGHDIRWIDLFQRNLLNAGHLNRGSPHRPSFLPRGLNPKPKHRPPTTRRRYVNHVTRPKPAG